MLPRVPVVAQLGDERLPKGPRFVRESLDADTGSGAVFQTAPLPARPGVTHPLWILLAWKSG